MDNRQEVKTFLTSRRAKISPGQAGLIDSGRRRVPGLRRSEVADLAGLSVEYYAQLERGNLAGVSGSVLDALARALRLDDAERAHLADLARAAGPAGRPRRRRPAQHIRPSLARVLEGMTEVPAMVNNGRLDALAANHLGMALFAPVFADPTRPAGQIANHARFTFLNPSAHTFWPDWERAADDSVATLRTEAGRDPYDKALTDLVGELSTHSDAFRTRWAAHDVRLHRTGTKHLHHPVVGDLHLSYEVLGLAADPGLSLIAFTAPPGTPDDDALKLLASWAATHTPADALTPPDRH
ncbi:helix-turn-helix transcriptional regulator [Nonomuraea sp. NEAU-A123]|uniref:helix-turn-helix transcriptional regulator n=1 Tax=Nonomuraea sp. NEAU-A123 TaxID=2839649 RepID=UPI001BE3FA40|nr:helix-turn-helix transcriptional regulator [Nonomuraea sp. NEAU-A123]MBT2225146.1 helix-turn-helix transcriptional regulator [Nonomuraea sp. NEAU-A123]